MAEPARDPAQEEVRLLLRLLAADTDDAALVSLEEAATARLTPADDLARWADSGAMALSGDADGPPAAPATPVASRVAGAGAVLAVLTAASGRAVELDAPALLGERAALRGLHRRGAISAGGGCRLLRSDDGWVAVSLNREPDWELVPAWLGVATTDWLEVADAVRSLPGDALTMTAAELGLAVAVLPPHGAPVEAGRPWLVTRSGCGARRDGEPRPLRVVDLSALWAGPLCASLLGLTGADVVTVESTGRPDGARRGDPQLHRLLHHDSTVVHVDLATREGVDELHRCIDGADVVITAARPRALLQLGLDPAEQVRRRSGLTWVAITAYGTTGPGCNRVGYGDDTAAAAGLVLTGERPRFCADAVADPLTGLYAAIAALSVARAGGGLVDVALRDVAAHVARPPHCTGTRVAVRDTDGAWVIEAGGAQVPVRAPRSRRQ